MEFHESDYIDESFLEEIKCSKCPFSFPLYLFSEHELMCPGNNPDSDDEDDDADESQNDEDIPKVEIERTVVAAVEVNVKTPAVEVNVKAPAEKRNVENLIDQNLLDFTKLVSIQEQTHEEKEVKKDRLPVFVGITADDFQGAEDEIKLENKAIALNSFSSKTKLIEENKPSFKAPTTLKELHFKPHIRNELTESDNEDGETLEEFWRRADVKLAQRMRKIQETKGARKM